MSRPSASPSLAARFSALLSRDSTPDSSPAKRSAAATRDQELGARSPPKSPEHGAAASSSSSAVSSPAPSPSTQASPGFFGALKLKASEALAAHRSENAAKELAKKAGLHRLNQRLFLLQFSSESASSSASASAVSAEAEQQFKHLDSFLNAYHPGTHLVLDIGGVLSSHGCPEDLFPAARLALDFNMPAGSDSLGPIDAAARIAQAVARWYSADGDGSNTNVVVLACDPLRCLQLLAAVVLYCTEDFDNDNILSGAMHAVLILDSNRFSAQLALRSLPVSSRRFLSDFALLRSFDPGFHAPPPKVWIHSLVIHCLPQVEEEGTRLLVVLIANRREFVYTSQQQGGGHLWIPTSDSSPLTVSIPIAAAFQGEATLKIWHLPEHSSTRNPRVLIVETKLHSAVLDLPCWRIKSKEEERIDGCIPAIGTPAAAAAAAASSDSSASAPAAAGSSDAPLPYPLHRMLLRKDDLELGGSSSGDSNAAGMGPSFLSLDPDVPQQPEIDFHKRFGITIVATPLEESRYPVIIASKEKGGTPAKDTAAASAARERSGSAAAAPNRSRATSPQPIPAPATPAVPLPIARPVSQLSSSVSPVLSPGTPETDLLALSAAYNLPPAAAAEATATEEAALEFNPTPLPSAMSPSTPPRKVSAAASSSSARSIPAPAAAASSSSASSSSSATAAASASSWVAPVIPVPALARSTAGLRFWHEDKHGRERTETASEQSERARLAAERVALDAAYGRGQWKREGGILYAQAPSGPRNPGMFDPANLSLEMILRAQGSLAQEQAQARALHAAGLAAAPPASYASQQEAEAAMHAQLISQHQQQQQAQHEAHQRQRQRAAAASAAAAARPQGPSAEQIYSDPNSTPEQKDEAYARILQAQFNEEDEQMQHRQQQPRSSGSSRSSRHRDRSHRSARPAAAALAAGAPGEVAPPNSAAAEAEQGPRMVRAGSEPMGAVGSGSGASSSAPAAGSPLDAALVGSGSMQISAAASIPSAAAAAAAPSASVSASAAEILPPEFVQLASDMELARSLQSQFDSEASSRSVAALSQAQHGLDPDQLHYDQLLSLAAVIGPAPHARRGGASSDEISALPEFAVTIESRYLEEECQVCRESFVAGETLRQLQCIHAYHKDCIDPWLRQNRTCPVCKVPVHHAR